MNKMKLALMKLQNTYRTLLFKQNLYCIYFLHYMWVFNSFAYYNPTRTYNVGSPYLVQFLR
jgi:hypothetical protein